jgi:lysophospholipase L1-like esterase
VATAGSGGASGGSTPIVSGSGGASTGGAATGGAAQGGTGVGASDTGGSGGPVVTQGSGGGGSGAGGGRGGMSTGGTSSPGAGGGSAVNSPPPPPTPITACVTNELAMCKMNATPTVESFSIPYSLECHFGGNPGNYEVTVELGGSGATDTLVEAERRRPMLPEIMTTGADTQRFSFVVNVRTPEGEPIQAVPAGIPGLDVYFGGAMPRVTSICHQPAAAPVVLYVAGDSTVCDQYTDGYASWGQHLPQFFVSPVAVANYADSGESSVSFIRSNSLWGAIKSRLKPGDWVLLEMGHNDKTTAKATYESNMSSMASDAKAAGATPIFVTPISRANGGCSGQLVTAAMDIPQTLRDLGKSMNIPVIDLTTATCNWFATVGGPAAAMAGYYARGSDPTHTGPKGAQIFAGFVRDAIKAQVPELAKYLRP